MDIGASATHPLQCHSKGPWWRSAMLALWQVNGHFQLNQYYWHLVRHSHGAEERDCSWASLWIEFGNDGARGIQSVSDPEQQMWNRSYHSVTDFPDVLHHNTKTLYNPSTSMLNPSKLLYNMATTIVCLQCHHYIMITLYLLELFLKSVYCFMWYFIKYLIILRGVCGSEFTSRPSVKVKDTCISGALGAPPSNNNDQVISYMK